MKKAIVVGSGIAGLASSIRLAHKGYKVSVYEKNDTYGGKLGYFKKDGFRFDTGPSLFTMPQYFEDLFFDVGYNFSDFVTYEKLPSSCKYFFDDYTKFVFYQDKEKLKKELNSVFKSDEKNVLDYLVKSEELYENSGALFIENSLHKLKTFFSFKALKSLPYLISVENSKSLHAKNKKYLNSEKLIQIFDRYATYNGSSPYKTPGMMSMIPHLEQNIGTFFPKGGMRSLVDALYQLALKLKVDFNFNSEVNSFNVENSSISSIVVNDVPVKADLFISNMDVALTYKKLLKDNKTFKSETAKERTSSGVVFYWGINKVFEDLDLHNIFFSSDYHHEFNQIFEHDEFPEDPTIYVNITCKHELIDAPEGKENWFVMVNVPSSFNYSNEEIELLKNRVLIKLSKLLKVELSPLILTEEILHPKKIKNNTNAYLGALYGTASNSVISAFNRHSNFSTRYKNLYFVGGTVHPGGGIPLCLNSAKIVVDSL